MMARQNAKKLHLHKMSILNKNIEDYFAVSSSAPPRPPLEAKTGAVSSAKQEEGQPSHKAAESQEQNDFAGPGGSQRSLRAADQDKLTPLKSAPLSSQVLRGGGAASAVSYRKWRTQEPFPRQRRRAPPPKEAAVTRKGKPPTKPKSNTKPWTTSSRPPAPKKPPPKKPQWGFPTKNAPLSPRCSCRALAVSLLPLPRAEKN